MDRAEGRLDAPAIRGAALEKLGRAMLDELYRGGLALGYDEAVARAGSS